MKNKAFKTKLLTVLLALCMVLSLVPMTAFAADPATETADFTASDGGAAAIALLNQYKSFGAADSTWDNGTKTLTLRGIDFTTKAATAVKLPDRTTIVLTDGTTNTITGGDAAIAEDGGYNKHMVITALKAMGDLKVKGGASGTGTLSVTSGTHKNTGEAWTYSCAIGVADGDFEIEGGHITAQGGTAYSADCAFSVGVRMDNSSRRSKILLITGGSLTAIGGESYDTEDPQNPRKSFSDGVTVSKGSISVTGSGKLTAKCVPAMDGEGLAFAVQTFTGDLLVSHNGEVTVAATNGISVSAGGIKLSGGKLRVEKGGVGATKEVVTSNTEIAGSIEVNGGALYAENSNFSMKKFTVTGGTVRTGSMLPDTVNISGGTVQTRYILAKEMTLSNATLTIREPVNKLESGTLYTSPALWLTKLTVNSGTLDVAWDWGEIEPTVFPMNTEDGFPTPLVKIWGDGREATFNGGVSTFDTGCAGNIALKLGKLSLGENMVETGAANTNTDAHTQAKTGTPVVFSAFEPYPVQIGSFDAAHKTYDGTTAVTLYGTLDGVADGDGVTDSTSKYSWYVETVISEVRDDLMEAQGLSAKAALQKVYSGGLSIYTNYDPDVQAAVDAVYQDRSNLDKTSADGQQIKSAMTIVDNFTGYVVAIAGDVGVKTRDRIMNWALVPHQPGSSFKPLSVYSPAIEMGLITPASVIDDNPILLNDKVWPRNDGKSYKINPAATKYRISNEKNKKSC